MRLPRSCIENRWKGEKRCCGKRTARYVLVLIPRSSSERDIGAYLLIRTLMPS